MQVHSLQTILCIVGFITLSLLTPGQYASFVPVSEYCSEGMWSPSKESHWDITLDGRSIRCAEYYLEVESLGRCLWHIGYFGDVTKEYAGTNLCYNAGRIAVPKTESENDAMRDFVVWSQNRFGQTTRSIWPTWSNAETAYHNAYCTQEFTEVLCESDVLCVDMPAA